MQLPAPTRRSPIHVSGDRIEERGYFGSDEVVATG